MGKVTMKGKDAISGSMAELFVTIAGNRYNFAQAISFEANFEKEKTTVPVLGRTGKANKSTGWSGSGSMTLHYNNSIMRDAALQYKNTGEDLYFDMQVTNEDPTSSVGRQTVTFIDCNFDSIVLAKFDADADYLDEDVDFTFDDFEMPEKFKNLQGMI